MKTENREELDRIISELRSFKKEIRDWDYDADVLYCLNNALHALEQA